MFFLIGGVQPKKVRLDKQARFCPSCSRMTLRLTRLDHYLSLFFIPLFPVKKGVPFLICENCDSVFNEEGIKMQEDRVLSKGNCPNCGRLLDSDFVYCPSCGKKL